MTPLQRAAIEDAVIDAMSMGVKVGTAAVGRHVVEATNGMVKISTDVYEDDFSSYRDRLADDGEA